MFLRLAAFLPCVTGLIAPSPLPAQSPSAAHEPVTVRFSEGTVHGFLELRNDSDTLLAYGDLLQVPGDSTIETRMVLHFLDKSVFEETTTFSQHGVFRLETYHLLQQGPAFSADLDATLSRDGRFAVTSTAHKGGKQQRFDGRLALPADVYNGLPVVLARNLRIADTADVHIVAFTPKPRLIGLRIAYAGTDSVWVGGHSRPVARFVLTPQLGALTAFFARLFGKLPPDGHLWMMMDDVPAFIRFEGPMYTGPVWRLSPVTPSWPRAATPSQE